MIIILILSDIIMCLVSFVLSLFLRTQFDFLIFQDIIPYERLNTEIFSIFTVIIIQTIVFYTFGLYSLEEKNIYKFNLKDNVLACIVSVALIIITIYFYSIDFNYQRSVITVFMALQLITINITRKLISRATDKKQKIKNIIFVGKTNIAKSLILEIEANPYLKKRYRILGILTIKSNNYNIKENFYDYPILGSKEDIQKIISKYEVDEILIASEENWQDKFLHLMNESEWIIPNFHKTPDIKIIPSPYEIKIGKLKFSKIHDIPTFDIKKQLHRSHHFLIKRLYDIFLSIIMIILSLPVTLITALLIKLTSKGPVFYYQKRVGKDMKRFTIIKFRTMIDDAEKHTGFTLSPINDSRITPIGKILRVLRIDELPQLINVLKGDMSFVGPRPERVYFVNKFKYKIDSYIERFKVKPGLTGLAQIQGYYHTKPEVKIKYDLAYIYNWSFWLEIRILLETIKVILTIGGH